MLIRRFGAVLALTSLTLVTGAGNGLAESPLMPGFCTSGGFVEGVGASFAQNLHDKVGIPEFNKACGKGTFKYLGGGSGAGKAAYADHSYLYAGSDEPLSFDEQMAGALDADSGAGRVSPSHHIPIGLGAITVSVNLEDCGIGAGTNGLVELNLRSQVIGSIFSGIITDWNDGLIGQDQSDGIRSKLSNCGLPITVAVREDVSGTTYAFKDFLSKRNPQFQVYKQNQFNTAWPIEDLGGTLVRKKKNDGVANLVDTIPGAIGYVELAEASRVRAAGGSSSPHGILDWARVDNPAGEFLSPNSGLSARCEAATVGMTHPASTLSPGWDAVSITDGLAPGAYPICTMTYALVYNNLLSAFGGGTATPGKAQTLVDYLDVLLRDSTQTKLGQNGYAALPVSVLQVARAGLLSLVYA
ncbi:MAG: substrate-binding domain-containing protein [Actinomycetota bacterium]